MGLFCTAVARQVIKEDTPQNDGKFGEKQQKSRLLGNN